MSSERQRLMSLSDRELLFVILDRLAYLQKFMESASSSTSRMDRGLVGIEKFLVEINGRHDEREMTRYAGLDEEYQPKCGCAEMPWGRYLCHEHRDEYDAMHREIEGLRETVNQLGEQIARDA